MLALRALFVVVLTLFSVTALAGSNLRIEYGKPVNDIEAELKQDLLQSGVVDSVTHLINDYFDLPETLVFYFGGDDGPMFDGQTNHISTPLEFVAEVKERFINADYEETGVTPEQATHDALMHTLFHEFAHAVISIYALPVLGKEEDAADALATVLLIEFYDNGQEIALSAADLFNMESGDRNELGDEDFWDEHSLDEQRYFTTLCHVYGSDPEKYGYILEEGQLSEDRADMCIDEYSTVSQSWIELLKPHIKAEKRKEFEG